MTDLNEDGCEYCGHSFSPHVLVALEAGMVANTEVPVGGIMLCPECDCVSTWAVDGHPVPPLPTPEFIRLVRETVIG